MIQSMMFNPHYQVELIKSVSGYQVVQKHITNDLLISISLKNISNVKTSTDLILEIDSFRQDLMNDPSAIFNMLFR